MNYELSVISENCRMCPTRHLEARIIDRRIGKRHKDIFNLYRSCDKRIGLILYLRKIIEINYE